MSRKVRNRYALTKDPFTKDVPVEELFESPREQALTRLKAAIHGRSSAAVTGESGTGKTFLFRALEASLPPGRYRLTYVHNSTVNLRDFYRQLSSMLGLEPKATPSALFREVRNHIEELSEQSVHPVLALDEAHLAPVDVLGHLHILLNFHRDSKPFLSLLLIGLPQLRERLARNTLSSLAARIPTRVHLDPLDPDQVRGYLRHRLEKAGSKDEVFAEDAVLLLAEATGGVMRKIDVLAATALEVSCESKSKLVDASVVQEAVRLCAEALV